MAVWVCVFMTECLPVCMLVLWVAVVCVDVAEWVCVCMIVYVCMSYVCVCGYGCKCMCACVEMCKYG